MIDPKWIVSLKGRDYPLYAGILDAATEADLLSLTTRIVQIPTDENGNMAVVMARAEFKDGRVFEDVGDASPQSVASHLVGALLRLASTRAKGRVLRDSINVGQTMFEELPDLNNAGAMDPQPGTRDPGVVDSSGDRRVNGDDEALICQGCGKPLTLGQSQVSTRSYGTPLCPTCQKQRAGR
ncbi:MAG TPA: hypothetical protein VGP44_08315 [Gemmatimonadales bacterium]|nr:hypothetical protein [Gemmatimonadales bacterium]